MKDVSDIVCMIWDYGTFISVAEAMGRACKKCYYYSPFESEYRDIKTCCIGEGLENVQRCNQPFDPKVFNEVDLHIFPDIGYGGLQKFLRSQGKAVWGSMGMDSFELFRDQFLDTVKSMGLPVVNSVRLEGLTALKNHLNKVKDKWVKVSRFRANMETWKHIDMEHSIRKLEALAVDFGGMQEQVTFIVQDVIDSDVEIGFDGWCISGKFPKSTFQGYEKKNELYLGSLLDYDKLPDPVKLINRKFAPLFEQYGYRNFMATEIRVKDKKPYFIDPTFRLPGQTGEHLFTTCRNMPDVIWRGANGILVEPQWEAKFVMEATMHYTGDEDAWRTLRVPDEVADWVKLYHYCMVDGVYQFPVRRGSGSDELGVICGAGDTIQDAFKNLTLNFEKMKNEPVKIELEEFAHLLREVEEAEKQGIEFTSQPIPKPEIALKA